MWQAVKNRNNIFSRNPKSLQVFFKPANFFFKSLTLFNSSLVIDSPPSSKLLQAYKTRKPAKPASLLVSYVVFNTVALLGLLSVVPAVERADEIQNVIDGLFIPSSASRPAVRHIFSRLVPCVARSRGDIISVAMLCP